VLLQGAASDCNHPNSASGTAGIIGIYYQALPFPAVFALDFVSRDFHFCVLWYTDVPQLRTGYVLIHCRLEILYVENASWCWWLTLVILATWAEIKRITIQSQPWGEL
jgi:hypothetical protein